MKNSRRFTPEEKLELVLQSYRLRNLRVFCKLHGIDHASLYRWRREAVLAALENWRGRRPGRPSRASRETVESLREALGQLAERHAALQREARAWQLRAQLARKAAECGLGRALERLLAGWRE